MRREIMRMGRVFRCADVLPSMLHGRNIGRLFHPGLLVTKRHAWSALGLCACLHVYSILAVVCMCWCGTAQALGHFMLRDLEGDDGWRSDGAVVTIRHAYLCA